jgi:glycosyltransferase involved in cell wall biosynthesis
MSAPLISGIVPVFNGERYLAETLDSMLGQTYVPLEVIVADDGSTDGTRDIVAGYGERVRHVHQPNRGHAAARNLGLAAARGEFVAFLDSDDLWHPVKLERQMDLLRARPEVDACVSLVQSFWTPELADAGTPEEEAPVPGYRTVCLLAPRTLFETVGPFDASLRHGSDTDWFLRALDGGARIELLPEVLVRRRLHETNRSRLLADNSRREYVRVVKAALDRRREM